MIVGVHSDESYVKLKNKHTIDNTEKRMSNVKKYADQVSLLVMAGGKHYRGPRITTGKYIPWPSDGFENRIQTYPTDSHLTKINIIGFCHLEH